LHIELPELTLRSGIYKLTEVNLRIVVMAYWSGFHFLPNSLSTFAFTLSSILINGGQARLKPSPGIFFVASMPGVS